MHRGRCTELQYLLFCGAPKVAWKRHRARSLAASVDRAPFGACGFAPGQTAARLDLYKNEEPNTRILRARGLSAAWTAVVFKRSISAESV